MSGKHWTVLVGLIGIAVLFFSGGRTTAAQDGGGVVPQVEPPCDGTVAPPSSGVLCGQMDSAGGSASAVNSQNFLGSDASYCAAVFLPPRCLDSQAADDFVVPTSGGVLFWTVDKVEVTGAYLGSGYTATSVNVDFYASTGTLPGTNIYQDSFVPTAGLTTGSFVIDLTRPAALPAGQAYWLSVQANLDLAGQSRSWYWGQRTVQANNASAWINPLDGSGLGCTTWKPRVSQCSVGDQPDLLFRLSGNLNYVPLVQFSSPTIA